MSTLCTTLSIFYQYLWSFFLFDDGTYVIILIKIFFLFYETFVKLDFNLESNISSNFDRHPTSLLVMRQTISNKSFIIDSNDS